MKFAIMSHSPLIIDPKIGGHKNLFCISDGKFKRNFGCDGISGGTSMKKTFTTQSNFHEVLIYNNFI